MTTYPPVQIFKTSHLICLFVLFQCIELYTIDDGEQRVGFYSLEMAKDLEVEPKPRHVIAFQDAGDCKSLCYIIQAHLDMLGNGQAFVVAQPPKVLYFKFIHTSVKVSIYYFFSFLCWKLLQIWIAKALDPLHVFSLLGLFMFLVYCPSVSKCDIIGATYNLT